MRCVIHVARPFAGAVLVLNANADVLEAQAARLTIEGRKPLTPAMVFPVSKGDEMTVKGELDIIARVVDAMIARHPENGDCRATIVGSGTVALEYDDARRQWRIHTASDNITFSWA